MVYVPNNIVLIPNFRNNDSSNPYKNRVKYCKIERMEFLEAEQQEISDFVEKRTDRRVRLEDLMEGGKYNTTPFKLDDSLVPILFGGFMLGEGCMTQEELEICLDPFGDGETKLIQMPNRNTYFSSQNTFLTQPLLSSSETLSLLGDRNTARKSSCYKVDFSNLTCESLDIDLYLNSVTRILQSPHSIEYLSPSQVNFFNLITSNPFTILNASQKITLYTMNKVLENLFGIKIKKIRGCEQPYTLTRI